MSLSGILCGLVFLFEWGTWRRWWQLFLDCLGCIVSADLPEVHGLGLSLFRGPYWTRPFGCDLWNCCLLDGPAGVPHKFGFLFSFHSFKRSFLFGALIGHVASIFPMKETAAGLAEVRVLSLSLFHGLCWTCPFGCVLWSCYCLAPSWVEWKVGLCKGQILLADPCLTKVPY